MSPYMVKRIVGFVTVIATMVLVFIVGVVLVQSIQLGKLNEQSRILDQNIDKLIASKSDLENGIKERNTEEYIEEQARENLGMIKDGEIIFIFD